MGRIFRRFWVSPSFRNHFRQKKVYPLSIVARVAKKRYTFIYRSTRRAVTDERKTIALLWLNRVRKDKFGRTRNVRGCAVFLVCIILTTASSNAVESGFKTLNIDVVSNVQRFSSTLNLALPSPMRTKQIQNSAKTFKLEHQAKQAKKNAKNKTNKTSRGGCEDGGGFETAKQARSEKEECENILRVRAGLGLFKIHLRSIWHKWITV